jgi:hypothetical protein
MTIREYMIGEEVIEHPENGSVHIDFLLQKAFKCECGKIRSIKPLGSITLEELIKLRNACDEVILAEQKGGAV